MKILLIEPFFTGSHQQWAEGFAHHSEHEIKLLSLPGFHWKWRMYGGAVTLAQQFLEMSFQPDLILATDMLDLTTFLALTRKKTNGIPTALYFHENQITYPWSPTDADVALQRNNQYGFLNYTSALVADAVLFNSHYHKDSFIGALPEFLQQFPDFKNLETIDTIQVKSHVLHLGMDLNRLRSFKTTSPNKTPLLLWNHRWEYDKNPELFFETLFKLQAEDIDFQIVVLGEAYSKIPAIFKIAKEKLAHRILHFGYADSFSEYAKWLWKADILPVTSNQDFFGGSVVEGIFCGCFPILPKRLAYEEHIPKGQQKAVFYEQDEDFLEKLKSTIVSFSDVKTKGLQKHVAQYDWKNCIKKSDTFLKSIGHFPF